MLFATLSATIRAGPPAVKGTAGSVSEARPCSLSAGPLGRQKTGASTSGISPASSDVRVTMPRPRTAIRAASLFAALALFHASPSAHARSTVCGSQLSNLRSLDSALLVYALDHGGLPTTEQGLKVLYDAGIVDPLRKPVDYWGTPYRYRRSGAAYDLRSAGPDKTFNTEDDLTPRSACPRRGWLPQCSLRVALPNLQS